MTSELIGIRQIRKNRLTVSAMAFLITAVASPYLSAQDSSTPAAKKHPLEPALNLAYRSREAMKKITDYEAIFTKKEFVNGRYHAHTMFLKNRLKPFSVYLKFQSPHAGREVIYVKGQNKGNLIVHETGIAGLVGAIPIVPTSSQALSESKHPITSIGMWNLIHSIILQWENEMKYDECTVKYYRDATVGKMTCNVIESRHPTPRKQFPYQVTRLYLQKKTYLPIRVEQYRFADQPGGKPVEDGTYTFTSIRANVGLQNTDFDVRNPKYSF